MAKIGLPKGSGKRFDSQGKVSEKSGNLKWILSGNPVYTKVFLKQITTHILVQVWILCHIFISLRLIGIKF